MVRRTLKSRRRRPGLRVRRSPSRHGRYAVAVEEDVQRVEVEMANSELRLRRLVRLEPGQARFEPIQRRRLDLTPELRQPLALLHNLILEAGVAEPGENLCGIQRVQPRVGLGKDPWDRGGSSAVMLRAAAFPPHAA